MLFLNMDGVLLRENTTPDPERDRLYKEMFGESSGNSSEEHMRVSILLTRKFATTAMAALEEFLISHPDVDVILSSAWRLDSWNNTKSMQRLFQFHPILAQRTLGVTPDENARKEKSIWSWIREHKPPKWIVMDDVPLAISPEHFVLVSNETLLTIENMQEAAQKLFAPNVGAEHKEPDCKKPKIDVAPSLDDAVKSWSNDVSMKAHYECMKSFQDDLEYLFTILNTATTSAFTQSGPNEFRFRSVRGLVLSVLWSSNHPTMLEHLATPFGAISIHNLGYGSDFCILAKNVFETFRKFGKLVDVTNLIKFYDVSKDKIATAHTGVMYNTDRATTNRRHFLLKFKPVRPSLSFVNVSSKNVIVFANVHADVDVNLFQKFASEK